MKKLLALLVFAGLVWFFLNSAEDGAPSILERWRGDGNWLAKEPLPPGRQVAVVADPAQDAKDTAQAKGDSPPAAVDGVEPPDEDKLQAFGSSRERGLRIVDIDGNPEDGVRVELVAQDNDLSAIQVQLSTRDGELEPFAKPGRLRVDKRDWIHLGGAGEILGSLSPDAPLLVVAKKIRVSGTALDHKNAPISGAQVRVYLPLATAGAELKVPLAARVEQSAQTDEAGEFRFESVPWTPYTRLEVSAPGFELHVQRLERLRSSGYELRLARQ